MFGWVIQRYGRNENKCWNLTIVETFGLRFDKFLGGATDWDWLCKAGISDQQGKTRPRTISYMPNILEVIGCLTIAKGHEKPPTSTLLSYRLYLSFSRKEKL